MKAESAGREIDENNLEPAERADDEEEEEDEAFLRSEEVPVVIYMMTVMGAFTAKKQNKNKNKKQKPTNKFAKNWWVMDKSGIEGEMIVSVQENT